MDKDEEWWRGISHLIFPQDDEIVFDEESHKYSLRSGHEFDRSVTALIKDYTTPFDPQKAVKTLSARTRDKWGGGTDEDILALWEAKGLQARTEGTRMHKKIEDYLNTRVMTEFPEAKSVKNFTTQVLTAKCIHFYRAEMMVYTDRVLEGYTNPLIAGTMDLLGFNGAEFFIYDWKRTQHIKTSGYRKCKPPFQDYHDCDWTKYSMQLHIYRWILLKFYGVNVPVKNLFLVRFYQTDPYELVPTIDLSREVDEMFKTHSFPEIKKTE